MREHTTPIPNQDVNFITSLDIISPDTSSDNVMFTSNTKDNLYTQAHSLGIREVAYEHNQEEVAYITQTVGKTNNTSTTALEQSMASRLI